MAATTTTPTLEERVDQLEKKLKQLVEGLWTDVVGYVPKSISDMRWDPTFDWDPGCDPDDQLLGAWKVTWSDQSVTHW